MNKTIPLIEADRLRTWFPIRRGIFSHIAGWVRAVDDVSLHIEAGETVGLVGESGCGKTTFGRTLIGLEKPTDGTVHFKDEIVGTAGAMSPRSLGHHMQMIFQDPYSSLNPRLTVIDILTEGLIAHRKIRRKDRSEKAVHLLHEVGMDADALHRFPHEFSGGQRQRISIARAISLHPALIICDEAVSALDVSIRAQVLNLLIELRSRYNLAYLFISHDLSVIRYIAQRVAVMYLGQIVEYGPCATVLENPRHPYTRALIRAVPIPGGARHASSLVLPGDVPSPANPPQGCRFHPRCPFALPECRLKNPLLESPENEKEGHRTVACLRCNDLPDFV